MGVLDYGTTSHTPDEPERGTGSYVEDQEPANDGGGGYPVYNGGGYYGGSGSGSGSNSYVQSPEDQAAEMQQQGYNLADIAKWGLDSMTRTTKGRINDSQKIAKERYGTMQTLGRRKIKNIDQSRAANDANLATQRRNIMQQVNWQPNQQKEQSTLMALRNRMGNAAYGSGIQDLVEGMQRVDDMNDTELINTWKQNENAAYDNWYQADTQLVADRNEAVLGVQDDLSQFKADYKDQLSKIKRDFQNEQATNYKQYWAQMSNLEPRLATKDNMQQARRYARYEDASDAAKETLDSARDVRSAVSKMVSDDGTVTMPQKGTKMTSAQKKAVKIINQAKRDNKGATADVIKKAINDAALENVKLAKKDYIDKRKKTQNEGVSYTSEEGFTYMLPNTNLLQRQDLGGDIDFTPSKSLQKMMTWTKPSSSQNPRTAAYVRGDRSYDRSGTINTRRAANRGFTDNLAPFRRV